MHLLLLAVALGAAEGLLNIDYSKIPGKWRTIAIAVDNLEKIEDNGELKAYFREVECDEGCNAITIRFYVLMNGECIESTVVGRRREGAIYDVDFSGQNYFEIICNRDDHILLYNVNVDANGKTTHEVLLAGNRYPLTAEEKQMIADFVKEKNIPEENIRYIIETDPCPN